MPPPGAVPRLRERERRMAQKGRIVYHAVRWRSRTKSEQQSPILFRHIKCPNSGSTGPSGSLSPSDRSPIFTPMNYQDRIVIEPEIRFGKPCIRGTRITVGDVLSYLASGMSEQQILADFPQLTSDDVRACLAFAAERERRVVSIPDS